MKFGHGVRFTRLIGIGLLAGMLLAGGGAALATPAGPTEHGPCRIAGDEFAFKCVHYKLQEAKRVGGSERGACTAPAVLIRDGALLYWTCAS